VKIQKKLKKQSAGLENVPQLGCSFTPSQPSKKIQRQSDGMDCHEKEILSVLNSVVLSNYQSFSLSTAFQLTAHIQGISATQVEEVFNDWTRQLERENRIIKSPLFDKTYLQPKPKFENKFTQGEA
jgi:hypothetical protein